MYIYVSNYCRRIRLLQKEFLEVALESLAVPLGALAQDQASSKFL